MTEEEQPRKTFKTTRDILEMAESVHRKLKAVYGEKRVDIEDSRAAMLMDAIEQKEKHLKATVGRYLKDAGEHILDTYYQFAPDQIKDLDILEAWHPEEDASVDEVLAMVLKLDALMHAYYRRAAEMASEEPVREMFENLAEAVAEKKRDEVQNSLRIKDI
jgi:hypothetical protein